MATREDIESQKEAIKSSQAADKQKSDTYKNQVNKYLDYEMSKRFTSGLGGITGGILGDSTDTIVKGLDYQESLLPPATANASSSSKISDANPMTSSIPNNISSSISMKSMLSGMPGFPQYDFGPMDRMAKEAGEKSESLGKKQQAFEASDKEIFAQKTKLLQKESNLNNDAFTQYVSSSDKAKGQLEALNSKYPVLNQADIINNMSIGEKVTTGAIMLLGSLGGAPLEKNPAWQVFNNNLNEAVQKQAAQYDRAKQEVLQSQFFNDKTFSAKKAFIDSDYKIKDQMLQNNENMVKAQAFHTSDNDIKRDALMATDQIKYQRSAMKYNMDAKQFEFSMLQKQMEATKQANMGSRTTFFNDIQADFDPKADGNLGKWNLKKSPDPVWGLTNLKDKQPEVGEGINKIQSKMAYLDDLRNIIAHGSSSEYNDRLKQGEKEGFNFAPQSWYSNKAKGMAAVNEEMGNQVSQYKQFKLSNFAASPAMGK